MVILKARNSLHFILSAAIIHSLCVHQDPFWEYHFSYYMEFKRKTWAWHLTKNLNKIKGQSTLVFLHEHLRIYLCDNSISCCLTRDTVMMHQTSFGSEWCFIKWESSQLVSIVSEWQTEHHQQLVQFTSTSLNFFIFVHRYILISCWDEWTPLFPSIAAI